ncbi:unnamed protein product [Toxocara canis]|uniref:ABC transmembrane type-1 domain-containing protein n=1 Tax=Toxocara canis TaxID=6265 RepID=A0A183UCD3_TOXCA|nr:unnamed protein product [Toxocara canis]
MATSSSHGRVVSAVAHPQPADITAAVVHLLGPLFSELPSSVVVNQVVQLRFAFYMMSDPLIRILSYFGRLLMLAVVEEVVGGVFENTLLAELIDS